MSHVHNLRLPQMPVFSPNIGQPGPNDSSTGLSPSPGFINSGPATQGDGQGLSPTNIYQMQMNQYHQKLNQLRTDSYAEIYAHEAAHASAAGAYGGGIHIDFNALGIAVGGHVPIQMAPSVGPEAPEETIQNAIQHASIVMAAAAAPGADMSSQDSAVYAAASATRFRNQANLSTRQSLLGKNPFAFMQFGNQTPKVPQQQQGQYNPFAAAQPQANGGFQPRR